MSTPKIIRVLSPNSKSQTQHQTTCSDIPFRDRSSLDTIVSNQKTSQMQNYYSLLIDQVKKLSRDNDRMWKLLTQTQQQHSECNKTQSKLQQSLQQAQKQLSTLKQLYDTEKSNFNQSKIFYEKREKQWQSIVGQLKKVIQVYESTQEIDMERASQIFQHTQGMKQKMVEQLPGFDNGLSIYSRRNGFDGQTRQLEIHSHVLIDQQKNRDENDEYGSIYCTKTNKTQQNLRNKDKIDKNKNIINVKYTVSNNETSLQPHESHQSYNDDYHTSSSSSILSTNSRKHRSKLLRSKNFIQRSSNNTTSLSAKKICQNVYMEEITRFNTRHHFEHNPQDTMQLLTIEDVFERALRKTYIKHRSMNQKALQIMLSPHMQKLKTAKSSTKQRLQKTIRKLFLFESQQQLDDIIKFIEQKVYKKYHLLKGELIFKFLQQKFKQCEIVFDSSNSALERLDREPSNIINGVLMNQKFKQFENKKRSVRQSANLSSNSLRKATVVMNQQKSQHLYMSPSPSSATSNHFTLAINSNIKSTTPLHSNNHITSNPSIQKSVLKRENSQKNIYTEKRLSRRPLIQQLSSKSSKRGLQNQSITSNLSDLIGM